MNDNCAIGSTAPYLAANAIRGGLADCTLALGSEKGEAVQGTNSMPGYRGDGLDNRWLSWWRR